MKCSLNLHIVYFRHPMFKYSFLKIPVSGRILSFFIISAVILNCNFTLAQCPSFINTSFTTNCINSGSNCNLCSYQTILLNVTGNNLPQGACVKWYYSQTQGFNPYNGEGTYIDCGIINGNIAKTVSFQTTENMCSSGSYYIVGILDPILPSNCPEILTDEFSFNVYCPQATIDVSDPVYEYHDLNLYASGGTNYNWSGPSGFSSTEQNPTIKNVDIVNNAGTYTVTVTDAYGCKSIKSIEVAILPWILILIEPSPLILTEICSGDSLSLKAKVLAAANGNYLIEGWYTWQALGKGNFITTDTILNIGNGGGYVFWVKDTITQVEVGFFKWVNQLTPLDIKITPDDLHVCSGGLVTAFAHPNNGIPDFKYLWSNGSTSDSILISEPGTYSVTMTDQKGCHGVKSIVVTPGSLPKVNIIPPKGIFCPNESKIITAKAYFGTAPYSYNWDTPLGKITTPSLSTSVTGNYVVTVTDALGCVVSTSLLMYQNPDITIDISPINASICINGSTQLTAVASGGSGTNYLYEWTTPSGSVSGSVIATFETGIHSVTVTDGDGCKKVASINVQITPEFNVNINPEPAEFCSGGSIDLEALALGGDGNYTYEWSTPVGILNTKTIVANQFDHYSVTVTDSKGCFGKAAIETIQKQNMFVSISAGSVNICTGDSITLVAKSQETGLINYNWSTPEGIKNGEIVNADKAGTYIVTITNSNGCTGESFINITEVSKPNISIISGKTTFCPGSDIELEAISKDTNIISLSWNTPIGSKQGSFIKANVIGQYIVTATNSFGCSASDTVFVNESSNLNVSISPPTASLCVGGSIDLSALATGNNLIFTWLTPSGIVNGQNIKAHLPGDYIITVTDGGGCTGTANITLKENPGLDIYIDPNPVSICNNGSVKLNALSKNGTSPFAYFWNTPEGIGSDMTFNAKTFGKYYVTITDKNGCKGSTYTQVSKSNSLNLNFNPPQLDYCKGKSFDLAVSVPGGQGNYTYSWNSPSGIINTPIIKIEIPGTYQVTVSDSNGCTGEKSIKIKDESLSLEIDKSDPVCANTSSGSINLLSAVNGVLPMDLTVNKTQLFKIDKLPFKINNLNAANYNLEIVGANGCQFKDFIGLSEPQTPELDLGEDVTIYLGEKYTINPHANFIIDSIYWTNKTSLFCSSGCLEPIVSPLINTNYKAIAYNNEGCKAKDDINVYVIEKESVYVPNSFSPNGDGINDTWVIYTDQTVKQIKKMYIYDRWGESLLIQENIQANELSSGWNGNYKAKPLSSGVYIYYVLVEFNDGRTKEFKGDINLIR